MFGEEQLRDVNMALAGQAFAPGEIKSHRWKRPSKPGRSAACKFCKTRVVRVGDGAGEYWRVVVHIDPAFRDEAGGQRFRIVPAKDGMSDGFIQRKLLRPIIGLLKQGVTPEKMAQSLALGVTFGIFPALGWTTALCAIAALVLHLNLPAIQMVNYFMYPAQIALLIPFFRLGEWLFGARRLATSVPQMYAMIHTNVWSAIRLLWTTTWHAIVVWCVIAPVIAAIVYAVLTPMLRRVSRRMQSGTLKDSAVEAV